MTSDPVERRLAAIVSADVVGYSRLMARDEVATVRTLNSYRDEMTSIVSRHGGRVVDSPGDNILIEFSSATAAVEASLAMQDRLRERNSKLPLERRMEFRMGVHLGEVLVQGVRIYGDGVNLAARLEAIAEPGGICVSKAIRDQVGTKTDAVFTDLGLQPMKGFAEAVGVFAVGRADSTSSEDSHTAVIIAARVDDFGRLAALDEAGTNAALQGHRVAVDPIVYSHGGRLAAQRDVTTLYEFPSGSEAVKAAIAVQALMAERNILVPEGRRMAFKLGAHLGEAAIGPRGEVTGEAVAVAQRVVELSEAGGLLVSDAVHDALEEDLEHRFTAAESIDAESPSPIRLWALTTSDAQSAADMRSTSTSGPTALVVLPFERLGNDPEQDYLVDGITEDLTTSLTAYREFRVVPRSSAFAYRNQHKSDREIARELDATYVLRGSVRVGADRVRITAHLVDAERDRVIWSERLDRSLGDIFALQDEIAESITLRIAPEVLRGELSRSMSKTTGDLESWDLFLRGKWHYYRTSREDYAKSVDLLQQAIAKDPQNGQAMAFLGFVLIVQLWRGWSDDVREGYRLAAELGERAVALDASNWRARATLAMAYAFTGQHDRAMKEAEQCLPWYPTAVGMAAWLGGDLDKSLEYLTKAVQQSPGDPDSHHWRTGLAYVHYTAGNYPAALVWAEQALQGLPDYLQVKAIMAATLAQLGRVDDARSYMREFLELQPGMTAAKYRTRFRFRNPDQVEHYLEGLIKAGLPPT